MSTNFELKARIERLGPVRDAAPVRLFSDDAEAIVLRRTGRFDQRITVAQRLRASGLSLKAAHTAISELAAQDWTLCQIPVDGGIDALAQDLLPLDVALSRRRPTEQPAAFIAGVRSRHRLSQRDFAGVIGVDVRTLQNWEQGRNTPDQAVLTLITIFDRDPAAVTSALFPAEARAAPLAAE